MPGASTAGSALSGAASGAAAGTAVLPGVGTVVGGLIGGVGGYLSGKGTQDAQNKANQQATQQAAMQSAQSFANYLSSRGVSLQQIAAANPQLEAEWNRIRTAGDKRDFQTWLYDHLRNSPSDPVWTQINSGQVGGQNTTLPAWAVDANGNPLQPALLQELIGLNNQRQATQQQAIVQAWANGGGANLRAVWDAATPEDQAGYGSFENFVLADYEANATPEDKAAITASVGQATGGAAGPAGTGNNTTLDPAIASLIPAATATIGGIFDGTFLNQTLAGLKPVQDARTREAAAIGARVNELRGLSGNLLDTELAGIADVLNARTTGAGGIYDATISGARGVNEATLSKLADLLSTRNTGAKNVYDAELLRADTFSQAAQQALSRMLAEQSAERARRGFTGGSSGSDIVRARLRADYTQRGAGERATAGVNYQTRLGQASEADSVAKLTAGVELARLLGQAGVTRATSMAGAGEQNAIAALQARVADATRRLGYLTADADIAATRADLQNAQDALNALLKNQTQQIGAVGAPFTLAAADLSLKNDLTNQQYTDIDALMKRLQPFTIAPSSGPALATPNITSVLNNQQIAGGALASLGSMVSNQASTNSLADLIKTLGSAGGSGGGGGTATLTAPNSTAGLLSSPNFLANTSVFKLPGG